MPLNYVTQVIYIPKVNINRPSPKDETVSHPNYRVILYTQSRLWNEHLRCLIGYCAGCLV